MIHHRAEERVCKLFEIGLGKFFAEELYDLRIDSYYLNNVAGNATYEETRQRFSEQLMAVLRAQGDPRVVESDCHFERSPFTD